MKKSIIISLAMIISLSITSCSSPVNNPGTSTSSVQSDLNSSEKKVLSSSSSDTIESSSKREVSSKQISDVSSEVSSKSNQSSEIDSDIELKGKDYTVKAKNVIDINKYKKRKHGGFVTDMYYGYFCLEKPSAKNTYMKSDIVISCRIDKVEFIIDDDMPFTKTDVTITNLLKGKFKKHDKISVLNFGGYIPKSIEDNMTEDEDSKKSMKKPSQDSLLEYRPCEDYDAKIADPKIGEEYVFFLSKSSDGYYMTYGGIFTTYKLINKGKYCVFPGLEPDDKSVNRETSLPDFTIAELKQQIKEWDEKIKSGND